MNCPDLEKIPAVGKIIYVYWAVDSFMFGESKTISA